MTDNIQKLYEIADIEKKYLDFICKNKNCEHKKLSGKFACVNCFNSTRQKIKTYPPFTAEKQLELIKWLASKFSFFAIEYDTQQWSVGNGLISGFPKNSLEESIVDYISSIWQDLSDDQKQEIKEILQ